MCKKENRKNCTPCMAGPAKYKRWVKEGAENSSKVVNSKLK